METKKSSRLLLESIYDVLRSETIRPRQRSLRAWAFQVYILMSLISFAVLAIMVTVFPVIDLDIRLTQELQAELPTWSGSVLQFVSWFGYTWQSLATCIVFVSVLYKLGLRCEAVTLAFASLVSLLLNMIIKYTVRRPRPTNDLVDVFTALNTYSFPSGHVMFYTVFFGFLAFLSFILIKRVWLRTILLLTFISLVITVGPSRVYLGEHWTSDVIGAYIIGFVVLFGVIRAYRISKIKLLNDQPVAPWNEVDNQPSENT